MDSSLLQVFNGAASTFQLGLCGSYSCVLKRIEAQGELPMMESHEYTPQVFVLRSGEAFIILHD